MEKINTNESAALAATASHMAKQNPANAVNRPVAERIRVPMTHPMRKMEVPELPGYWLQWIRGTPERVQQAKRAFFEHVYDVELDINNMDIGGDGKTSGNTNMGTIVSTGDGSGQLGQDGQPIQMYLMKQRKDYHDEDAQVTQRRNDSVVDSLTANFRQGTVGVGAEGAPAETPGDTQQRYVGTQSKVPDLFKRKVNRS